MNRFASGLIAGGILGAVGAGLAMSDGRTRRRVAKSGKRTMKKANDMVSNVTDMF